MIVLRFKGEFLNSLSNIEELEYFQPTTYVTTHAFNIPTFEDGYTYAINDIVS